MSDLPHTFLTLTEMSDLPHKFLTLTALFSIALSACQTPGSEWSRPSEDRLGLEHSDFNF